MPADFSRMLQNPKLALRDAELQKCAIARDAKGQPLALSGSFAVVFKGVRSGGKAVALRAFTSEAKDRQDRYHEISNHLNSLTLPCLVKFKFHEKGIRSTDGKWYPLVEMEWVSGVTLFEWVEARCKENNRAALTRAADQWIKLVESLQAEGIAHGDLQHANVMVADTGQLMLVDYDCMYVPKLARRPNLEVGVEPYQHPKRDGSTLLSPLLDDFSALFILLVMKALGAAPDLWARYMKRANESETYDKLLLRKEDLDQGPSSLLCKELLGSPEKDVRQLTQLLLESWKGPIEKVPRLAEALNSFSEIEKMLAAGDWDGAVPLIEKKTVQQRSKASAALQKGMTDALERVRCREALERAAAKGDEKELGKLYIARLVDDYPKAQPVVRLAQTAAKVIPILGQLAELLQKQDGRRLNALWDANQSLLKGRASANSFVAAVESWRNRNRACDDFLSHLKQEGESVPTTLSAWEALEALGGHPECTAYRSQMQKIASRQKAWSLWQGIDSPDTESNDQQRISLWNEQLFAGWPLAEKERDRLQEARQRLKLVDHLRQLDKHLGAAATLDGERKLSETARALDGYPCSIQERVLLARERLDVAEQLARHLDLPGAEKAAMASWEKLVQLNGTSLVSPSKQKIVHLVGDRLPALEAFRRIPAVLAEATDSAVVRAWKEDLFSGWPEAEKERRRLQDAQTRLAIVEQLCQLDQQLASAAPSLSQEELLLSKAKPLTDVGYAHGLATKIQRIRERVVTARALVKEGRSQRPSELSLAEKWQRLDGLEGTNLVPPETRDRALLACARAPHLHSLLRLPADLSINEMDEQVLQLWKPALDGCAEAAEWRPRFEAACERKRLIGSLKKCVHGEDDWGIAQTTANPLLKGYKLPAEWHDAIQLARQRYREARAIVQAFKAGDAEAFGQAFNAAIVRRFAERFARLGDAFVRRVDTLIQDGNRLELELPHFGQAALVPLGQDIYKLSWKWPDPRFTETVVLAVCHGRPKEQERDPHLIKKLIEQTIQKRDYELAGGQYRLHTDPSWRGKFVVIWAVIDLGFTILHGKPLILGGLTGAEHVSEQSRWR